MSDNDLLNEQGNFISLDTLQMKYNIKTNHVTFLGLKNAIISDMRKCNICRDVCLDKPFIPINIQIFVTTRKGSKAMYDVLNRTEIKPGAQEKWGKIFEINDLQWKKIYSIPFLTTNI